MSIGAVDLGTNSVRLLVAEIDEDGLKRLNQELKVPRLGENIHQNGFLKEDAIKRTIKVLQGYKKVVKRFNAQPSIIATSAVRDANNREEFVTRVKKEVGWKVTPISGEEEARLSYLGVISELSELARDTLVIDIGGGSTEFIWGQQENLTEYKSINLGAIRLTESFGDDLKEMKQDVKTKLEPVLSSYSTTELVGVGGTITTLSAIDNSLEDYQREVVHASTLSYNRVEEILDRLASLSLSDREEVIGLDADRADIILAGIIILLVIMEQTKIDNITVSDAGILEGIVHNKL
ncbi:Ppx/GppA phosphatase family protein [Halanaerocella petrolearia]